MLEDLQKTFDAAFFNADHNLKLAAGLLSRTSQQLPMLSEALEATGSNLATMAFCFAQLLAKTILYSENSFVLKENNAHLQLENNQLKSDKTFMKFVRKLTFLHSGGGRSKRQNRLESSEMKQEYATFVKEQHPDHPCTNNTGKTIEAEVSDDRRRRPSCGGARRRCSADVTLASPSGVSRHFLGNATRAHLYRNVHFFGRGRAYNQRTFCALYRHFREVELLAQLEQGNCLLQKNICRLQCELANYRLVVCYLNNQLSGRIQQIQLLTKGPRTNANFEQVWADLESRIQLNKFKTIVQALGSKQFCFTSNDEQRNLFDLIHNQSNVDSASVTTLQQQLSSTIETVKDESSQSSLQQDVQQLKTSQLKAFHPSWFNLGLIRFVFLDVSDQGLGVAIIGGKEYGLPILISQIYEHTPAAQSRAFKVGDIILTVNFQDVTDMSHDQVVVLLKALSGSCRFGVIYLKPTITDGENMASLNVFADAAEQATTPTKLVGLSGGQLDALDVARLCGDYYRSVYNTLVVLPPSTRAIPATLHHETLSSTDSSCSLSLTSSDEDDGDKQTDKTETASEDLHAPAQDETIDGLASLKLAATAMVRADGSKALPGMAARV